MNPTFQVDENISDEDGFTADIGVRGRWKDILSYDVSLFGLFYNDRLGEVQSVGQRLNAVGVLVNDNPIRIRTNVGDAVIYGFEGFGDLNLKQLLFPSVEKVRLNYFVNLALTESEYVESITNSTTSDICLLYTSPSPRDS